MTAMAEKLTNDNLEQIAEYLSEKFPILKEESRKRRYSDSFELELRERTIRVEEELKNQRELIREININMREQFILVEKRFEQVDKRFEQVDKRFEEMRTDMNTRFEQVDKRFEDLRTDMNTRFEQVDNRFTDMYSIMVTRFEQVDKRFNMMMWFTGLGFTLVTVFLSGVIVFVK